MQDKLNESLGDLEEGLPEPSDVLAILQGWRRREEILPLFNKEEAQEAAKEETPKLNLKPLPMELKYTYLEENKQCCVVISSFLTTHQEISLLKVLKRCKKAIGRQISDLKGISFGRMILGRHLMRSFGQNHTCQKTLTYRCDSRPKVTTSALVPTVVMASRKACLSPSMMNWLGGKSMPTDVTSYCFIPSNTGSLVDSSLHCSNVSLLQICL